MRNTCFFVCLFSGQVKLHIFSKFYSILLTKPILLQLFLSTLKMLYKENMKVRHDTKKNRPTERGLLIYHLTSSPCLCVEHGENSHYFEGRGAGANI